MPELDLTLLLTLRTLLEERNVTRASGLLGVSQPAMSGRLAKLRRLLGDPLFVPNSSGRGVIPTPRAQEIEPAIAGLIDSMLALMRAPTGFDPATATRTFTIACFETPAAVLAPLLAAAFRTRAPRARFSFVLPGDDVGEQLEAGDADLLLSGVEDVPGHLMHRTVWRDHYACARTRGAHPQLDLDVFCEAPHVVVASGRDRFSTPIDDRLAALGRSRWVAASVQSYAVAAALAASGEYICTLPRRFLERQSSSLELHEPPLALPELSIGMFWHPRMHEDPAHGWLRNLVRDLVPGA